MVMKQERELMVRYLSAFGGQWRVITEADQERELPSYCCDLCYSDGDMARLRERIVDTSGRKEFVHFEPYLCDDHAHELGVLW